MAKALRLTRLTRQCEDVNTCPTVYVSDHGTLVFQGPDATCANGLELGAGELAVEISVDLAKEAIRAFDDR